MKVTLFNAQRYDQQFFDKINTQQFSAPNFQLVYQKSSLGPESVNLAQGSDAVCVFVNDRLDAAVLEQLARLGVPAVLLRCAGFNNID
jgi:D-lactate dehydrogenase